LRQMFSPLAAGNRDEDDIRCLGEQGVVGKGEKGKNGLLAGGVIAVRGFT